MTDPDNIRDGLELLLRKLLLGEELVNTQFHLFSARSLTSGRVTKPRVVCANNTLLSKSSRYLFDLLANSSGGIDPFLNDLAGDNDVPIDGRMDDYGYGSDSDLDDCDEPFPEHSKGPEPPSATLPSSPSEVAMEAHREDEAELSDDESSSADSDIFVMSSEHLSVDEDVSENQESARLSMRNRVEVQDTLDDSATSVNSIAMRLRSLSSRHILVRDTAYQTWYCLLNYLSTGNLDFLPLTSTAVASGCGSPSSTSALSQPKCSAKSMYRLARKVRLDGLRDQALAHIRSNLTEHNILKEVACSLALRHPQLLEMELDVLYSHIASPQVVADFPRLIRRIMDKELPHGADIILGIHGKFLKELCSTSSESVTWTLPSPPPLITRPYSPPTASSEILPPPVSFPCETKATVPPPAMPWSLPVTFGIPPPCETTADGTGSIVSNEEEVFATKKGQKSGGGGGGKKKKKK